MTTFQIKLDADTDRLLRNTRAKLAGNEIAEGVRKFFQKEQQGVVREIVTRHLVGGATTSETRRSRSGELRRSIRGAGLIEGGFPVIQVGSFGLAYARAQLGEEDTEILPKKGRALTIPVGKALTPTGRLKGGKGARDYGNELQFVPFKRKNANIFGALYFKKDLKRAAKRGQGLNEVTAVFLLARRTKIKATSILRKGFEDQVPGLADRLGKFVGQELIRRLVS